MSLVATKPDTAAPLRAGVASLVINAARRFAKWRADGRAARQLSRYPDALLKDMGISRSDIHGAVRHGRSRVFDVDMGNNVR